MKILAKPSLRQERLARKLSLTVPAYFARISEMELSRIERRVRGVTSIRANKLCTYFKLPFSELFEIVENKE